MQSVVWLARYGLCRSPQIISSAICRTLSTTPSLCRHSSIRHRTRAAGVRCSCPLPRRPLAWQFNQQSILALILTNALPRFDAKTEALSPLLHLAVPLTRPREVIGELVKPRRGELLLGWPKHLFEPSFHSARPSSDIHKRLNKQVRQ